MKTNSTFATLSNHWRVEDDQDFLAGCHNIPYEPGLITYDKRGLFTRDYVDNYIRIINACDAETTTRYQRFKYLIFIVTTTQLKYFHKTCERYGLKLFAELPPAVNPNYPENGKSLYTFIMEWEKK